MIVLNENNSNFRVSRINVNRKFIKTWYNLLFTTQGEQNEFQANLSPFRKTIQSHGKFIEKCVCPTMHGFAASRRLIWIRSPDFETVSTASYVRGTVARYTRNIERNVSKRKPAASRWLERDGTRCSSPFNAISARQFVFEGNLIPRQLTGYYSKALILPPSPRRLTLMRAGFSSFNESTLHFLPLRNFPSATPRSFERTNCFVATIIYS